MVNDNGTLNKKALFNENNLYLYLKPNGAMLMCDRRSDTKLFNQVAPVSKAVTIINKENIITR